MHFLFFWPVGEYYKNASSGVFYDGVNRKIPFLTNCSVKSFQTGIAEMGVVSATIEELQKKLLEITESDYENYISKLSSFRNQLSVESLAPKFRALVEERYISSDSNMTETADNSDTLSIFPDKL